MVKVSLDGSVLTKDLSKEARGFNGLLLLDGHLYMGYQGDTGSLIEVDKKTLEIAKTLPYQDMVGEMTVLKDHIVAVSNYSSRYKNGAKITILNFDNGEVIRSLETTYPAEHISYIDGTFYTVDNKSNHLELLSEDGKVHEVFDAPTMVTNMVPAFNKQ
jgi:outer membrane protein assembly factor BamB